MTIEDEKGQHWLTAVHGIGADAVNGRLRQHWRDDAALLAAAIEGLGFRTQNPLFQVAMRDFDQHVDPA